MLKKSQPDGFTEIHHALLFALISRSVIEGVGEQKGEAIIRKAVRQYGQERGHRMALRAQANKHALNMTNYIAYNEYKNSPGGMEQKIIEKVPHARVRISKCPWHTTWKENELLAYGRFYCLEIDEAVVRGFNPALQLDVHGTQTNGAAQCEFLFHDANLTILNYLLIGYRKAVKPGAKAVLPWDYHTGHLFKTLEEVVVEELGAERQRAIDTALVEFADRFGEQALQKVAASRSMDYSILLVS